MVQVVDDRYGVLELPDEETVVAPGETICSSDLGVPVTHVATAAEEGTTIVNNAVVTVRTVEAEPRTFQATDPAEVEVLGVQSPSRRRDDNDLAGHCAGQHRLELGGATHRRRACTRERWRAAADRTSAHSLTPSM